MSLFASHTERTDFADSLVTRIEAAVDEVWSVRSQLLKQESCRQNKKIDISTAAPMIIGLEQAVEAMGKSRRLLVIEAYDERRKPEEASDG